jgi:hypothetical protein
MTQSIRAFGAVVLFSAMAVSQSTFASGGYNCSYEVREWHGAGYNVVKVVSTLYSICGQSNAQQSAHERCERYLNPYRSCEFIGCDEDPWLACQNVSSIED